jgi:hypothetical protein
MSRNGLYCTLLLAVALLTATSAFAADKTAPDPRLSQPVTIECTGMRLHSVLDKISEKTGVAIRCGKNKDDWQVRDIPVVVSVKDLPLGKLLRALADCTHMLLSAETIANESDPKARSYRIWQDVTHRKELESVEKGKEAADLAFCAFSWDTAAWLNGRLDKGLSVKPEQTYFWNDLHDPQYAEMCKLLAELGPETRDRIISGETVLLSPETAKEPLRGTLLSYLRSASSTYLTNIRSNHEDDPNYVPPDWHEPTQEDLQASRLRIVVRTPMSFDSKEIQMLPCGPVLYLCFGPDRLTSWAKQVDDQKPPERPKSFTSPPIKDPTLDLRPWDDTPAWPNPPFLATMVELKAPKVENGQAYCYVISEVAKQAKLSLVREDFPIQVGVSCMVQQYYTKKACAYHILAGLTQFTWHYDERDSLVLGESGHWTDRHRNLVPEGLNERLQAAMDGGGLSFADYTGIMQFSRAQFQEWLPSVRYIFPLRDAEATLWSLYESLSPPQKAQALSDAGLPLASLDPKWVAGKLEELNKRNGQSNLAYGPCQPDHTDLPTSAADIAGLQLHLKQERDWRLPVESYGDPLGRIPGSIYGSAAWLNKSRYTLTIENQTDGKPAVLASVKSIWFPYYSAKRNAELWKKATEGTSPPPPKR